LKQRTGFHEERNIHSYPRGHLLFVTRRVHDIAQKLDLSKEISDRAVEICTDAIAMRICRFYSQPVMAAAALSVACRERRVPVTQRDLAEAAGCEFRDAGRCYEVMLDKLRIPRPALNGRNYLRRITIKSHPLQEGVYKMAEEMIAESSAAGLNGRNPMTVAAAALYLASCASGEKVTQSEVADAAGVAEESVRQCSKAMREVGRIPQYLTSRSSSCSLL
jgi:transcription initiation factor TFIIB